MLFYASNKVLERVVRKVLTFVARDKSKSLRGSSGEESGSRMKLAIKNELTLRVMNWLSP